MNDVKLENDSLPENEKEEIIRRRLICETCPFMSENAKEAGIYDSKRKDKHCIHCGCPIKTKTASLSSPCGIQFYNIRNPQHPMKLMWDVYNKEKSNERHTNETSG